jgi:hypothetical protein
MSGLFKMFGMSAVSMAVCAMFTAAEAVQATGRAGYANVRAGASNNSVVRMPTMPTLPMISVGNISTNIPTGGVTVPNVPNVPDVPDVPDNPDTPDDPVDPEPPVEPECPDGGVRNSAYTVDMCMDDVLHCVNNGALPNGLNNLFNEEVRHAVENGMGLCISQVERCIREVRRDCAYVYRSAADVWIDFNSRKVQPEYYNFVLRKTGLTPNQAENTCRLLDKNTYGPSFSAVANDGRTTAEYNKTVGAYNSQQGNMLVKTNPQGVQVNDGNPGVDGSRGHYARWDAESATCLIRVAAYNKDKHISNSWLFGAAGDDKPAEVWMAAGETFSCNKDLFGFSLMNDTSTVAVVGIGGGTVLGAGIGAIAGHGKREFDCSRDSHREMLMAELKDGRAVGILNEYLADKVDITQKVMEESSCNEIMELFDKYYQYETAIAECKDMEYDYSSSITVNIEFDTKNGEEAGVQAVAPWCITNGYKTVDACKSALHRECSKAGSVDACKAWLSQNGITTAAVYETDRTLMDGQDCTLKALNLDKANGAGIYCSQSGKCITATNVETELKRLNSVFGKDMTDLLVNGEKSNMGKSIGIGAAVGAGTGGLATAITAFVERNNINCRVGDGLEQVAFNKSHSIGSLKDFYVKWKLRVPDVIAPTALVTDCQSWKNTCAAFADLEQSADAQFNYKPAGAPTTTLVRSACKVSGSACIENYPVARSYGACE